MIKSNKNILSIVVLILVSLSITSGCGVGITVGSIALHRVNKLKRRYEKDMNRCLHNSDCKSNEYCGRTANGPNICVLK